MIDAKLKTFLQAAKWKSYTRTAEFLNLTQPAVTQHIRQLEAYYGVKLFARRGKQFQLTEEGELLQKYAEELDASSQVLKRMLENKSALVKRFHIGATMTIGEFVLPSLLGRYKSLNPNIDIIMHVHNLEEILKRQFCGEYDLSMVEGPFDKGKFLFQKMMDDELVLAASPESSLAGQETVKMNDVVYKGGLIQRESGSGTRMVFENKLLDMGYDLSTVKTYMEVGSIGAIKSLVEANLGYTVISRVAVEREAKAGILRIIPIRDVGIMREFNFVYTNRRPFEFTDNLMNFISGNVS